jgi:PTH1 family peptidyl-tRNA hydrolase
MILIVGLGNPGSKYANNRHNVGQLFIDYLASLESLRVGEFITDKFSNSQLAKFEINDNELILAKPLTFMNNSGIAVGKLVSRFTNSLNSQTRKIDNLIIIHDDLDIPLGKFHIQFASGPLLHNGLESIEQHLKTNEFWRLRIGVDARTPDKKIPGEKYSLQNFLPEEKKLLETEIFPKIFSQLKIDLKNQFKVLI